MKKRIIVALAASFALVVLASTAEATITITQAPAGPGYQNLSPWNCGGRTYYLTPHQGTDANGNPITVPGSGDPIRLTFGWGALNGSNMTQFFQNESGTVTITGTDSLSDSWGRTSGSPPTSADGIAWSAVASTPLTRPDGTQVNGVGSQYRAILSLAPGTYTLSVTIALAHPVNDGFSTTKGGLSGTCTFTVAP